MTVQAILNVKGPETVAVAPRSTVAEAAAVMTRHRIGAVLVRDGEGPLAGILSERDIVRAIAETGRGCLDQVVTELATREVVTCAPHDSIDHLMGLMTRGRFRHMPVLKDDRVVGLVSIGDVVKYRLQQAESESAALRQYIATG